MQIIYSQPNEYGAYPSPQNWSNAYPPNGYAAISDTLDMTEFYAYNGFVTLEIDNNTVIGYTPNTEVWEAWKASLPAPEPPKPTIEEKNRADIDYLAIMTGVNL